MLTLCIADAERGAGMKNLSRKSDTINRQAAINAIIAEGYDVDSRYLGSERIIHESDAVEALSMLPSAQPEVRPIDYQDCANAMLKMWMDNVVTDGEYNRIMDKLNTHCRKKHG